MDQPITTGEPGTAFIGGLPEQVRKTEPQVSPAFGSVPKPTTAPGVATPTGPAPFAIKELP
jgi:hypothetical protein